MIKISFNTVSVKNQNISTNEITKNNIEFLNDKRYIKDINSNIPHALFIQSYRPRMCETISRVIEMLTI